MPTRSVAPAAPVRSPSTVAPTTSPAAAIRPDASSASTPPPPAPFPSSAPCPSIIMSSSAASRSILAKSVLSLTTPHSVIAYGVVVVQDGGLIAAGGADTGVPRNAKANAVGGGTVSAGVIVSVGDPAVAASAAAKTLVDG